MAAHRILYVEDEEDIRDTMSMLLEHEGYRVTAVRTAEEALEQLAAARYDLLLTDYQLPNESAAWLLTEARRRGSLGDTPVIVLSGAHEPSGIDGHRFLRKPISQETLFAAFEALMPAPIDDVVVTPPPSAAALRLRLYVSGDSQTSRRAQRNLMLALHGIELAGIDLQIHDITEDGGDWTGPAEEDRIIVTPTLVRTLPGPRVWIAGDLSNLELVREAILAGTRSS